MTGKLTTADSAADLAALQGLWEQTAFEADGSSDVADTTGAPGALTRFVGNQFFVRTREGDLLLAGTFTLDAAATPKRIDWSDATGPDRGKTLPAIYRLENDRFIFIAGDEGAPRPTLFRTSAGQTMRSFVRCA